MNDIYRDNFTIDLFGVEYLVQYSDDIGKHHGLAGRISFDQQAILISKAVQKDTQRKTLLHEIMHEVLRSSGLEESLEDANIDIENFNTILTNSLFNVLKSNKPVFKGFIVGEFDEEPNEEKPVNITNYFAGNIDNSRQMISNIVEDVLASKGIKAEAKK